jgi:hypothetical protein
MRSSCDSSVMICVFMQSNYNLQNKRVRRTHKQAKSRFLSPRNPGPLRQNSKGRRQLLSASFSNIDVMFLPQRQDNNRFTIQRSKGQGEQIILL